MEIIGLHEHVIEFKKRHRALALEAELHRVEGQHAVDGEMHSVIAQELDIGEFGEPLVIVGHDRVLRT